MKSDSLGEVCQKFYILKFVSFSLDILVLPNISVLSHRLFQCHFLTHPGTLSKSNKFLYSSSGVVISLLRLSIYLISERRGSHHIFKVLIKLRIKNPVQSCLLLEDSDLGCDTVLLCRCFPVSQPRSASSIIWLWELKI